MPHQIRVNGMVLDPKRAAAALLPMDTPLTCPRCNSHQVGANEPRNVAVNSGECVALVPREQDRFCLECRHQWTSILSPALYSDPAFQRSGSPIIAGRGR
jgi:hypothetical protein